MNFASTFRNHQIEACSLQNLNKPTKGLRDRKNNIKWSTSMRSENGSHIGQFFRFQIKCDTWARHGNLKFTHELVIHIHHNLLIDRRYCNIYINHQPIIPNQYAY